MSNQREEMAYCNYKLLLYSGIFWEMHPELSGDWNTDKNQWMMGMGTATDTQNNINSLP